MNSNFQEEMNERSPEDKKATFAAKRTTAKFRSMDLTSQSLGRINTKLAEAGKQEQQWGK